MKIAVIGTGWLGSGVLEVLHADNNDVMGVYRTRKPNLSMAISVLSDHEENQPEIALFCSTADWLILNFPPRRDALEAYAQDALRWISLISPSTKVLLVSSTGVYPSVNASLSEDTLIADSDAKNPNLYAEFALKNVLSERLTVLRMAGLIGKGRYPVKFMSGTGKTYNGSEAANVIHFQDAVGLIRHCLIHNISNETINACAPLHPTKGEFYTQMAEQLGLVAPMFTKGETGKIIDTKKSATLGYTFQFPNPMEFPMD